MSLDPRWFKEDRKLPKGEQTDAIKESEKIIRNSTLLRRRLKSILEEEVEATYRYDEDFENAAYERIVIANASTRKTLRSIIKLLD
jgi:ABC-type oligopeptide transport system ATPase subunit